MTFEWADWGLPVTVLGVGAVLGGVVFSFFRDRGEATIADQARRAAAEVSHAAALEALRHHDTARERMRPAAWQRERDMLMARGAGALRALDSLPEAPVVSAPLDEAALVDAARTRMGAAAFDAAVAAGGDAIAIARAMGVASAPKRGMAPEWRGALMTIVAFAILGVLVWFAKSDEKPRREEMGAGVPVEAAPVKAEIDARLAANPNDLDALNDLTDFAIRTSDAKGALEANKRALAVNPDDADALTLKGVLAAMVGMYDNALARFDEVLAIHPGHMDALVYKGLVALEAGRQDVAIAALQQASDLQPQNSEVAGLLLRAKGGAMPAAPAMAPPGAQVGPSSGELVISGTVGLAPGVVPAAGSILYVSLRDPAGGPPLAAVRRSATTFPTTFEVRTGDAIAMGGPPRPFPASMNLSIRIDGDGNPMTKDPSEPAAVVEGVAKGATGLEVTLAPTP